MSHPARRVLSWILRPSAWIYGRAALARRRRLEAGARHLPRPVISVGNITCGGTGKTPTVERVVRDLLALGRSPAILSRGYRARARVPSAKPVNDEYLVLEAGLPGILHLQGKDRFTNGLEAIARGADVLVLDDGFQHARLSRALDIVLIDALDPFGGGRVLPSGLLREPLEVLARTDLLAVTRVEVADAGALERLERRLETLAPGVPRILIRMEAVACTSLAGEDEPLESLRSRRVLGFCGIGNPESFRRLLLGLGVELADFAGFPDHHEYTRRDLVSIRERAERARVDRVLMTQKDAVKLPRGAGWDSWRYVRIESSVTRGAEVYREALVSAVGP